MACIPTAATTTGVARIVNQAAGLISIPNCCNTNTVTKHPTSSFSSIISFSPLGNRGIRGLVVVRAADSMATEISGIKIVKNPPESKLSDLGVRSWPKWGCPPSRFPWTYSDKETCYLLKGKVKVYLEGSDEGVEFGAGDLVEFPKGMSCTWDVSETVDKHYKFE